MRSTQVEAPPPTRPTFAAHGMISQSMLQDCGPWLPMREVTGLCPIVFPERVNAWLLLFTAEEPAVNIHPEVERLRMSTHPNPCRGNTESRRSSSPVWCRCCSPGWRAGALLRDRSWRIWSARKLRWSTGGNRPQLQILKNASRFDLTMAVSPSQLLTLIGRVARNLTDLHLPRPRKRRSARHER